MLLTRHLCRKIVIPAKLAVTRAMSTSAITFISAEDGTSVKDGLVNITFVDPSGARRRVPGYIGQTILATAVMHDIDLGPASTGAVFERKNSEVWLEPLFGEGPTCGYDHIMLNGKGAESAPPKNQTEERMLDVYWDEDELFPESRLASMIPLTKEMDGMNVFVPDRIADDIP